MVGWYRVIVVDGDKTLSDDSFTSWDEANKTHHELEIANEHLINVDVQFWVREA